MAIQVLSNAILIRNGGIATNADCCCTPPCLECPDVCTTCYSAECNPCRAIQDYSFTVSYFDNPDPYLDCYCDDINGTYVADITDPSYVCSNPTGYCAISPDSCTTLNLKNCPGNSPAFGINRKRRAIVWTYLNFAHAEISYTSGSTISDPSDPLYGYSICNDFTIYKGHYVVVYVDESQSGIPSNIYNAGRILIYMKSFNNGSTVTGCPEDQFYGLCSGLTAGAMTLVAVKGTYFDGTQGNITTCTDGNSLCLIGTVYFDGFTLATPDPCEETEEPPPP